MYIKVSQCFGKALVTTTFYMQEPSIKPLIPKLLLLAPRLKTNIIETLRKKKKKDI